MYTKRDATNLYFAISPYVIIGKDPLDEMRERPEGIIVKVGV